MDSLGRAAARPGLRRKVPRSGELNQDATLALCLQPFGRKSSDVTAEVLVATKASGSAESSVCFFSSRSPENFAIIIRFVFSLSNQI